MHAYVFSVTLPVSGVDNLELYKNFYISEHITVVQFCMSYKSEGYLGFFLYI
jgi:hypothetical protein